ncbi:HelD family protein [Guptibacillus algicola]|uniref:HelD family protein n=1 Tax=Guptibacillus algicola TaxID=225844 RepID=UPI001CD6BE8D|nr:UvrD-helicase domain-containing protein [Alkalihalobacillus algicola]MCA0989324.1 AAA family ATPase [Alkalihalobacillus algicola]
MQSAYREEKQQLSQIAAEINKQREKLKQYPKYSGDDVTEQVLESIREQNRSSLQIAAKEPYFARMDFQEDSKDSKAYYIGKVGVADNETQETLVVDWRAPVASMFYSFTGGEEEAYYQSPDGVVEGNIELKRNIVIRDQTLQRVVDSYVEGSEDLSGSDEYLLYRLSETKDNKLRDIVSTIQAKQNDIIRAERTTPLIIQGVAGSGKTTVALHRLAYLLYEYRETITADRMIIFAPNRMFLDYISGVLPELGVGGIQQATFADWVIQKLDDKVSLDDSNLQITKWFSDEGERPSFDESEGRLKGSIHFKEWIDDSLRLFSESIGNPGEFVAWEGAFISSDKITTWMNDLSVYPVGKKREMLMNRIKLWIKDEVKKIEGSHLQKEYRKVANKELTEYFKQWPKHTAFSFYKMLFQNKSVGTEDASVLPNEIVKHTQKRLRKKMVSSEDLAPLLYLQFMMFGINDDDKIQHAVIDEAQDFSPFQIALLQKVNRSQSFTILGDLAQGIHGYQGIHNWSEFRDLFQGRELYMELEQSYRSTVEIIEYANNIISHANVPVESATPVFRSGKSVKEHHISDERIPQLLETAKEMEERGMKTIAIVGRTAHECQLLFNEIEKENIEANLITVDDRSYSGGISITPIYLTKGLEFDAVILADVSETFYKDNAQDAKLLYVGCTRALHELTVFYSGKKSPLIK